MAHEVTTAREHSVSPINAEKGTTRSSWYSAGATEEGYTEKMKKNILSVEQADRMRSAEMIRVFSKDGRLLHSERGGEDWAHVDDDKVPKDAIITHNHPSSLGAEGIMSIGQSFSGDDIIEALKLNLKELRAVTPRYTFSLKRPKGGWGVSKDDFVKAYSKASSDYWKDAGSSIERVYATRSHVLTRQMAQRFGWNYTKKKG